MTIIVHRAQEATYLCLKVYDIIKDVITGLRRYRVQGPGGRSFCPCGVGMYHLPGAESSQKLSEPCRLGIFMEAS